MQSRGLLGSILSRPDRPQEERPSSHARPVTGSAVDPVERRDWTAQDLADELGGRRERPAGTPTMPWCLSNPRIVIVAIIAVMWTFQAIGSGVGSVIDGPSSRPTAPGETVPEMVAPGTASQGRYNVTVRRLHGSFATLEDEQGRTHVWRFENPAVRAVLEEHVGEQVLAFWQREPGGVTTIVGVIGTHSAVPPGSDSAISMDPSTGRAGDRDVGTTAPAIEDVAAPTAA